jgi:hypothetical protein
MKISSFIIGMVLMSLVAVSMVLFMGEVNNKYGRTDYNSTEFDSFNKLSELTAQAETMQNATAIKKDETLFDVVGGYVSSAFQAVRVSTSSINTFYDISQAAVDKTNIPYMHIIRSALITVILILIFVGIMLNIILHQSDKI